MYLCQVYFVKKELLKSSSYNDVLNIQCYFMTTFDVLMPSAVSTFIKYTPAG